VNSATGMLTPIGSAVAVGVDPQFVTADPSGKFLYVSVLGVGNAGSLQGFSIDPSSGALTSIAGSPFAAGTVPNQVAVIKLGP
jgi:6-phosphogluconolactonase